MALNTSSRKEVEYFIGTEIEHTPQKGQKTLFVVGVKPSQDIISRAKDNNINHIYFGTSQSFTPSSVDEWKLWRNMISYILKKGYWVTLDFGVEYANNIHEEGWDEYNKFIPMISVKLPYIKLYNYNATLKIDDTTWGHSNPGVWCHSLHTLMSRDNYTDWAEYENDETIS